MSLSRTIKILEEIVNIPIYHVVGIVYGGKILLYSNEGGFSSLWILDPTSGERSRLTREPVMWVAEPPLGSRRVVYTKDISRGRELQILYSIDIISSVEEPIVSMDPLRIFGLADDGSTIAFTGVTSEDIAIYIARKGYLEKIVKLPGFGFVNDIRDNLIVGYGSLAGNPLSMEIFIVDILTREFKLYTPKPGSINKTPIIAGDWIIFETNAFNSKVNELYALNTKTMTLSPLTFKYRDYYTYRPVEHIKFKLYNGNWLVIGKREGRSKVFLDGKLVKTPDGMALGAVYYNGNVYLSYSSLNKPSIVIEASIEKEDYRVILESKLPSDIAESFSRVGFTYISSIDGVQIPLYYVESKLAGRPGPTVLYIHGGPWFEISDSWNTVIAALIASGFNVIAPNFRGSTGYGETFRILDIGDPGGGDLEDIVAASKWAHESGLADRLYVMGYSYGGYMTLWALANKPELYECGVAGASVADWEEMYSLSDAVFRAFIEILFNKNMELLKERSPINKVDNITKPVCIIHPQNDTRTPLKPILNLMSRMLEKGKIFEAHIIPDMGHVITTIDDAIKILLPALLFLERCLLKPYKTG
ncbi:MAG: S9 family peptidase [Acidilobaceae archaeon]